jgi:uncharacterized peroxidase-related enzyme
MPYIAAEEHLPGITGLLEYRRDTAEPIRELTQFLLRGPSSLKTWERELIASLVSDRNKCQFCMRAHTAVTDLIMGESNTAERVKKEISSAPVSEKMKALLTIAGEVQEGGKNVSKESITRAKENGATDIEIHDTVLIAALFCLYNRYVDGLAAATPSDPKFYRSLAERIEKSYNRLPQGYDHLRNK